MTEAHLTAETCETVEEDGPCSLLCDLDALVEAYVPEGACAHFICAFPDGSERNIGVCR
ncbi:MAG: hypothetical protein K8M05_25365 [Deltaproteobacteria bacterium]|nr:hypothetical protein [Kofleriaceae bacterium]